MNPQLFQRHRQDCPNTGRKDRDATCSIWIDERRSGGKIRSLGTCNWEEAEILLSPNQATISQAAKQWTEQPAFLDRAAGTKARYLPVVNLFVARCLQVGILRPHQVTAQACQAFIAGYQAPATRGTVRTVLSQLLRFCVAQGWAPSNPVASVAAPKIRGVRQVHPLSSESVAGFLRSLEMDKSGNYGLLAELMLKTGLRLGDAIRLEKSQIQEGALVLRTRKTDGQVAIPLGELGERLLNQAGDRETVFLEPGSSARTAIRKAQKRFKRAFAAAEVPEATVHALRHTRASQLAAKGFSTSDIARYLGISSRVAEKHYIHLTKDWKDRMERMAEA